MSSGWIVEPLRVKGQDWSLVWYITKVCMFMHVISSRVNCVELVSCVLFISIALAVGFINAGLPVYQLFPFGGCDWQVKTWSTPGEMTFSVKLTPWYTNRFRRNFPFCSLCVSFLLSAASSWLLVPSLAVNRPAVQTAAPQSSVPTELPGTSMSMPTSYPHGSPSVFGTYGATWTAIQTAAPRYMELLVALGKNYNKTDLFDLRPFVICKIIVWKMGLNTSITVTL